MFGQARIEPADRRVMVAENLRGPPVFFGDWAMTIFSIVRRIGFWPCGKAALQFRVPTPGE
jgi:hypothetical protein